MANLERAEVMKHAQSLIQLRPIYLDTETTGTGPAAEVIEVALVDQDGLVLLESLVKPKGLIEADAMRVHGITLGDVQGAPTWRELWPQVESILSGRQVGIYNSEFDLRLMRQSHQKYWMNWTLPEENFFCIMKLYARFFGEWDARRGSYRWHSLENAGRKSGIQLPNSHRAKDDAQLARALLEYIAGTKATTSNR
jgi:DNA polymerase III subunit epsilon